MALYEVFHIGTRVNHVTTGDSLPNAIKINTRVFLVPRNRKENRLDQQQHVHIGLFLLLLLFITIVF